MLGERKSGGRYRELKGSWKIQLRKEMSVKLGQVIYLLVHVETE